MRLRKRNYRIWNRGNMPASSSVLSMPKNFCEPSAQHWKIHRLPVTAPGCWQLMPKWRKRKAISTRFTNSGRRSKKKRVISRVHARDNPAVLPEINPASELTLLQKDYGTSSTPVMSTAQDNAAQRVLLHSFARSTAQGNKSVRVSVQLPEFIIFFQNDFAIGQHCTEFLCDCNFWIRETVNAN